MPALRAIDPLPTHELAIRLFYLYDHFRREPVADSFPEGKEVLPFTLCPLPPAPCPLPLGPFPLSCVPYMQMCATCLACSYFV